MNFRKSLIPLFVLAAALGSSTARASVEDEQLAKAVAGAKVTLQQALAATASQGQPISAKFELEKGQLQLSVYTAKNGKYAEAIVDHNTGTIARSEAITDGEDLKHAAAQSAALSKVKKPLSAAVDRAEHGSAGFRAVSVTPELKGKKAVASVTLMNGTQMKTVVEPLE